MTDVLVFAAILLAALGFAVERFVSSRTSKSDPFIRPTRQGLRAGAGIFAAAGVVAIVAWMLSA
ncbi:hypothetical protein [Phycicoccus duodecadis]|uniref:Uncharacterized protein n=1 Tax=Phycicoccus duodecadis TaxID=173053 RepID=A0A2N3YL47_9MICO|nr:hypothetical protein [Phycicoccus duodecadis]PKW27595.1 hypothetical protein ATL31_2443 [Phycicoccus duodecadis]